MKTIGVRQTGGGLHLKGFPPSVRDFLELCAQLSSVKTYYPHGVFKFRTFEEADHWMRQQRTAVKQVSAVSTTLAITTCTENELVQLHIHGRGRP